MSNLHCISKAKLNNHILELLVNAKWNPYYSWLRFSYKHLVDRIEARIFFYLLLMSSFFYVIGIWVVQLNRRHWRYKPPPLPKFVRNHNCHYPRYEHFQLMLVYNPALLHHSYIHWWFWAGLHHVRQINKFNLLKCPRQWRWILK